MMNALRNNAKMFLWFIIGAFILSIFVMWGMKGNVGGGNRPDIIAKIGEEPIYYEEMGPAWRNALQEMYDKGEKNTEEKELEIKKEILQSLIDLKLQLKLAEKLNITASDTEIAQSIMNIRAFQTDNKFDEQRYYQILQSQRIRIKDFEQQQKTQIVLTKLTNMINSTIKVTDDELKMYYMKRNRSISADYVYFNYKNYLDELKIGTERMKDYYALNKSDYAKPERVKASHILIMADASPTSPTGLTDEQAKKKAEDILAKIKKGASFSELAKKNSGDPGSKDKGGDLGWFEKGRMVPEFEKAAFSLKKGEVSDLVKTQFGYHIIKTTDKEKGFEPTYEKVKDKIKEELQKQDGLKLVENKASKFLDEYKKDRSFADAAKASKVKVKSLEMFDMEKDVKSIKSNSFKETLFDLNKGSVSEAITGDDGFYIFLVTGEKATSFKNKKFQDEKEDLLARLKRIKFQQISKDLTKSLKDEAEIKLYEKNL